MPTLFGAASRVLMAAPRRLFPSPTSAGRRIVCSFSYLQRIGKAATTDVWFPAARDAPAALDAFRVEWAAVRQFEVLQEAGNLAIEDLDVAHLTRSFERLMKMRAGGYRVVVVTLGRYTGPGADDELRILDRRLQDEIARLVHMLYLEEQSVAASRANDAALCAGTWAWAHALPHVALTLGAMRLFERGPAQSLRQERLSRRIFHILDCLPQRHIVHDVTVGLTLPEASKQNHWVYIPRREHQFAEFQKALGAVFGAFDHVALGALQGRAKPGREIMPAMRHMTGYGQRLRPVNVAEQRALARAVC